MDFHKLALSHWHVICTCKGLYCMYCNLTQHSTIYYNTFIIQIGNYTMTSHTYCYVSASASRFLGPFFICSRLCSMSSSIVISPCLTFVKYLPRMCCGRVFQPGQGTWPGTSQMHWRSKLRPKLAGFCRMDAVACSSNRSVSLETTQNIN